MASVNKVILIGNLGKDPEIKYTQGGMAVAHFSLATNDRVKDKDGNWGDRTEWHNIVLFERKAEIAANTSRRGARCTSKAASAPIPGTTRRPGRRSTGPRSSETTWCCSAVRERAAKAEALVAAAQERESPVASTNAVPSLNPHRQRPPARRSRTKTYRSDQEWCQKATSSATTRSKCARCDECGGLSGLTFRAA